MMEANLCASIKQAIRAEMSSGLRVKTRDDVCVLTIPLRTLDGTFVEVFVEHKIGDYVHIHDAGKTIGGLHVQGLHWTDSRRSTVSELATRFGVEVTNRGVIQARCKQADAAHAILSIAQCMTAASADIIAHRPVVEESPIRRHVQAAMERWRPEHLRVESNVKIKGNNEDHAFDSVAHHQIARFRTVAIKTLPFSYGARVQTDRYGYLVLDIKGTPFDKWRRLAVVSDADRWPLTALKTIRKYSADTLELRSNEEHLRASVLTSKVLELAKVA